MKQYQGSNVLIAVPPGLPPRQNSQQILVETHDFGTVGHPRGTPAPEGRPAGARPDHVGVEIAADPVRDLEGRICHRNVAIIPHDLPSSFAWADHDTGAAGQASTVEEARAQIDAALGAEGEA